VVELHWGLCYDRLVAQRELLRQFSYSPSGAELPLVALGGRELPFPGDSKGAVLRTTGHTTNAEHSVAFELREPLEVLADLQGPTVLRHQRVLVSSAAGSLSHHTDYVRPDWQGSTIELDLRVPAATVMVTYRGLTLVRANPRTLRVDEYRAVYQPDGRMPWSVHIEHLLAPMDHIDAARRELGQAMLPPRTLHGAPLELAGPLGRKFGTLCAVTSTLKVTRGKLPEAPVWQGLQVRALGDEPRSPPPPSQLHYAQRDLADWLLLVSPESD
jgi:hypothetical protein